MEEIRLDRDKEVSFSGEFTINEDLMKKLLGEWSPITGSQAKYNLCYTTLVQARRHKKKRINKKWLKRYGYKYVIKTLDGFKLDNVNDNGFEFEFIKKEE